MITKVLRGLAANRENNAAAEVAVRARVSEICRRFPIYPNFDE